MAIFQHVPSNRGDQWHTFNIVLSKLCQAIMPTRKYERKKQKKTMKRSNLVWSCLLQVTAFAQLNCRLIKLLKTNQMWLKPINFNRIGRKPWVKKKWVFLSFSSVFQSCLNYVKAKLSCKGVMTIYQSQNIKVSPSVRLSGPSVLWLCVCSTRLLKTLGKGEIACNKQFLLFPQCFLPVF